MAQAPKAAPAAEGAEAPAPKSKKKLIIIIAAVALLAGGGGAAWYFLQPKADAHKKEVKKEEPEKPPVFVTLETFTVNLQPDPDEKFLQVDLTVKVAKPEQEEELKQHMPEIRNRVLMLLSSKKASELTSLEGKNALAKEITDQIKLPFSKEGKPQEIQGVFFTSFVVQ
jgi:flagellar FliL protein